MKNINLWPVLHLDSNRIDHAVTQACFLVQNGAHGIMIISMTGDHRATDHAAALIKECNPSLRLGINYLGMNSSLAAARAHQWGANATWLDAPGVRDGIITPEGKTLVEWSRAHPYMLIFAGVAFKGQPCEQNLSLTIELLQQHHFVPTTSGPATGYAPSADHLQRCHALLKEPRRLAVASGVTPNNVNKLGPWVTDILVATGISKDEHTVDKNLWQELRSQCGQAS